MSKSKKILKVLMEMIKDGISHMLAFLLVMFAVTVLFALIFMPALISIMVFGKELGSNIALTIYGVIIVLAFTYDFIDKFKRRMSRY